MYFFLCLRDLFYYFDVTLLLLDAFVMFLWGKIYLNLLNLWIFFISKTFFVILSIVSIFETILVLSRSILKILKTKIVKRHPKLPLYLIYKSQDPRKLNCSYLRNEEEFWYSVKKRWNHRNEYFKISLACFFDPGPPYRLNTCHHGYFQEICPKNEKA